MNAIDGNSTQLPVSGTHKLVLVTGPSGGGRTTALNALEDMGFETIINMPIRYIARLLQDTPPERPMALGLDVRNIDFSVDLVLETLHQLKGLGLMPELVYVECAPEVLLRRYSETRRRHPMAEDSSPHLGIETEVEMLRPIRARADVLIDTTDYTPHDLKAELSRWYGGDNALPLAVSVHSFSYKRGIPAGMDLVFDCRFLRNPHWAPELRPKTGQDPAVRNYIAEDPLFDDYFQKILTMVQMLLPAIKKEGRAHMNIGVGCTGGKHRSVAMAERLGSTLQNEDVGASVRHRELERTGGGASAVNVR